MRVGGGDWHRHPLRPCPRQRHLLAADIDDTAQSWALTVRWCSLRRSGTAPEISSPSASAGVAAVASPTPPYSEDAGSTLNGDLFMLQRPHAPFGLARTRHALAHLRSATSEVGCCTV